MPMRIVIVGAGVAGLAAALMLRRFGHAVTVVEKHPRPMPLLRGFTRAGLHFDTGFHIAGGLQPQGPLTFWLDALGLTPLLRPVPLRREAPFLFKFPDGATLGLPCGAEAVLRMVAQDFPGHEVRTAAFLRDMDRCVALSPYMNAGQFPVNGQLAAAGEPLVPPDTPFGGPNPTVLERLRDLPPALGTMLSSFSLLYGVPPDAGEWKWFSVVAAPFLQATCTLQGGGKSLAMAMERRATEAGVHLQCGAAVQRVDISQERSVQGVELENGRQLPCEVCLFTGHPRQLLSLLPPGALRPIYTERLQSLQETPDPFMLFAETRSDFLDNRVLFLPGDRSPARLFAGGDICTQPVYVVSGEACAERRALVAVTECPPLPAATPDYQQARRRVAEQFAASLRRRCPELDDLQVLDSATPATLRHWVYGSTGSLYGVRHDRECPGLTPLTRLKGLLLAGQNILLPGVLGGIVSAAVASGLLVGQKQFMEEMTCGGNG